MSPNGGSDLHAGLDLPDHLGEREPSGCDDRHPALQRRLPFAHDRRGGAEHRHFPVEGPLQGTAGRGVSHQDLDHEPHRLRGLERRGLQDPACRHADGAQRRSKLEARLDLQGDLEVPERPRANRPPRALQGRRPSSDDRREHCRSGARAWAPIWTIPATQKPAATYTVRVRSVKNPNCFDFSNRAFTITK